MHYAAESSRPQNARKGPRLDRVIMHLMPEHKEFKGISRANVDSIRSGLNKRGIKVPAGDDVEVAGPLGVKVQLTYSEPDKTLRLKINHKPIFVTESQIWKVIESGAGKALRNGEA
jgi:hypothetical protein